MVRVHVENVKFADFQEMQLGGLFDYVPPEFLVSGTLFTIGDTAGNLLEFRIANSNEDIGPSMEMPPHLLVATTLWTHHTAKPAHVEVSRDNGLMAEFSVLKYVVSRVGDCAPPTTDSPVHVKVLNIPCGEFQKKTLRQCLAYDTSGGTKELKLTVGDDSGNFIRFATILGDMPNKEWCMINSSMEVGSLQNTDSNDMLRIVQCETPNTWAIVEAFHTGIRDLKTAREIRVENIDVDVFRQMSLRQCFKYINRQYITTGMLFTVSDTRGNSITFRTMTQSQNGVESDVEPDMYQSIDKNMRVDTLLWTRAQKKGSLMINDIRGADGYLITAVIHRTTAMHTMAVNDTRLPLHIRVSNVPHKEFKQKSLGACLEYRNYATFVGRLTVEDECKNYVRFAIQENKPGLPATRQDLTTTLWSLRNLRRCNDTGDRYLHCGQGWAVVEAYDITSVQESDSCLPPLVSHDFRNKGSTLKNILAGVDKYGHVAVTDPNMRIVHLQVVPNIGYHRDYNGPATYCAIMEGGNKPVSFLHKTVANRRENYIWYCHISSDKVAIIERFEWPEDDTPPEAAEATAELKCADIGDTKLDDYTMEKLQNILLDNHLDSYTILEPGEETRKIPNFIRVRHKPTEPAVGVSDDVNMYMYWYISLHLRKKVSEARKIVKHIAQVKAAGDFITVCAGNICVEFTIQ